MKVLVYGAGSIGSLYAALLARAGQEVTILARGERLAEIREHGLRLEDAATGERCTAAIKVVERLDVDDTYDLVLVVLPKNRVSEVLPVLRENRRTPNIVFFGNNAAGPDEMVEALGRDRVLLGFPGAAATVLGDILHYLILSSQEQPTTIGELDGSKSARVEALAEALEAAGFPVSVCSNMDAWLKTHAVEISPTADALYMAGGDIDRLVRTRDALVLMVRAIREGHRVLAALGVPVVPRSHAVVRWLPEPLLLFLAKRMLQSPGMELKIGHALAAREEMRMLATEFRGLVHESGVHTPSIDALNRHIDPNAKPIPDGSSAIEVSWSYR